MPIYDIDINLYNYAPFKKVKLTLQRITNNIHDTYCNMVAGSKTKDPR